MFTPKAITSSNELPEGWFMSADTKDFDGVARLQQEFTEAFGEPTEGYVWVARPGFIHVSFRNERILK